MVANWSNGTPLVVRRDSPNNGGLVDLNFYPPSNAVRADFWHQTTDGADLMANALVYTANPNASVVPEPGSVTLLMTGLAGIVARRRRKRQSDS